MKLLIVDDHALFREGLKLLIAQIEMAVSSVMLAPSVEDAVSLIANYELDLILLDWHLNGVTGEDALIAIQESQVGTRVIVLSAERDVSLIKRAIDLGASGFIHKDSTPTELVAAIRSILAGEVYLPSDAFIKNACVPEVSKRGARQMDEVFPELTPRQISVLAAVVRGLPNKLIAREMDISEDTVKRHLTAVFKTMNVSNRTQAVYSLAQNKISL